MSLPDFSLHRLQAARAEVAEAVHRTPLVRSEALSGRVGTPVYLKCENLQKTGSFKVRGALHRIRALSEDERPRGVITISAGNHAQAVAWAASAVGVASTVVMPEAASKTKALASQGYGAEVILHGNPAEAFQKAFELAEERNLTFVHPFDDEHVVAGHASCMLEVLEDLPDAATVVAPVGGGGLASGLAVAIEATAADVALWCVEPVGAAAMHQSFQEGHAIVRAMRLLLERTKLLAEPAGAAGLAAVLEGAVPHPRGPLVVLVSGGNVDAELLGRLLLADAG
jgi:threonine dehydratase